MSSRGEVPTGVAGRAARLAVFSIYSGIVPTVALINPSGSEVPSALHPLVGVLVALLVLTAWLWIRLAFTGPRIVDDRLVVTSWWSRRVYRREEVLRFRSEDYDGLFFFIGWVVHDGRFASGDLVVELRDGTVASVRGTVCSRLTSKKMSEALNRWAGSEVGTGAGPRRQRRAQMEQLAKQRERPAQEETRT